MKGVSSQDKSEQCNGKDNSLEWLYSMFEDTPTTQTRISSSGVLSENKSTKVDKKRKAVDALSEEGRNKKENTTTKRSSKNVETQKSVIESLEITIKEKDTPEELNDILENLRAITYRTGTEIKRLTTENVTQREKLPVYKRKTRSKKIPKYNRNYSTIRI